LSAANAKGLGATRLRSEANLVILHISSSSFNWTSEALVLYNGVAWPFPMMKQPFPQYGAIWLPDSTGAPTVMLSLLILQKHGMKPSTSLLPQHACQQKLA